MKYQLIMADPPWQFETFSDKGKGKSPEQHYPCLSLEDIKSLDIASIAEKDSVLALWVYNPMLPECIDVMKAWGFKFVSVLFVWEKTTKDMASPAFGTGYYSRQNCEILLLGKRGKGLPVLSHSVRQEIRTPKEEHSKKPEEVRDRLLQLFGDCSRIELFARPNAANQDGWRLVGNEIDKKDIRQALSEISAE